MLSVNNRSASNNQMSLQAIPTLASLHHYVPKGDPYLKRLEAEQSSCWQTLKSCFCCESSYARYLEKLSTTKELPENWIKTIQEAIKEEDGQLLPALRKIVTALPINQLNELLTKICERYIEEGNKASLEFFLKAFEAKDFEAIFKAEDVDTKTRIQRLSACILENEVVSQHTQKSLICRIVTGIMETLLNAFSFFEIGKEPGSSWEASHLITVYGKIFGIPLLIFALLNTVCTPLMALIITTVAIASLILLVMIYLKYRDRPETMKPFHNLTKLARDNLLQPVYEREDVIWAVLQTLSASQSGTRKHPLLVGDSGAGKTELVNGIAQCLASKKGSVPENLRDAELFGGNTADLFVDNMSMETVSRFERFLNRLGPYANKTILFLDELQAIFKTKDMSDKFLKMLDISVGSLPYCIAAITTEDYNKYIKNTPFENRFKKIDVKSFEPEKVLRILKKQAETLDDFEIDQQALESISKAGDGKLHLAKNILSNVITALRMKYSGIPSVEERECESDIEFALSQYPSLDRPSQNQLWIEIQQNKEQLTSMQEKRIEQNRQWIEISKMMRLKRAIHKELPGLAQSIQKKESDVEEVTKVFFFIINVVQPNLEKKITKFNLTNEVNGVLRAETIDRQLSPSPNRRSNAFAKKITQAPLGIALYAAMSPPPKASASDRMQQLRSRSKSLVARQRINGQMVLPTMLSGNSPH